MEELKFLGKFTKNGGGSGWVGGGGRVGVCGGGGGVRVDVNERVRNSARRTAELAALELLEKSP